MMSALVVECGVRTGELFVWRLNKRDRTYVCTFSKGTLVTRVDGLASYSETLRHQVFGYLLRQPP